MRMLIWIHIGIYMSINVWWSMDIELEERLR